MTNEEYINQHPEQFKDYIDKWLFTEFGIMGGCCSAQNSHEYAIARMVAERYEKNLWKDAQGDDLPEIDREVIVLYQRYPLEGNEYAVGFAHRPPEYWDGKNIATGEVTRYYPKRYDKGGWNSPDIKWWLDLDLPIKKEVKNDK